ncbi:unnamed protein product, partial [Ectocarpus sp. 6 AP-2014]
ACVASAVVHAKKNTREIRTHPERAAVLFRLLAQQHIQPASPSHRSARKPRQDPIVSTGGPHGRTIFTSKRHETRNARDCRFSVRRRRASLLLRFICRCKTERVAPVSAIVSKDKIYLRIQ